MPEIQYSPDGKTLLRCPADLEGCFTIPYGVNRIGDRAFSGCAGLTDILLPDTIVSIGNYAFSDCSGLIHVYIPSSVTSVGRGLFDNCSRLISIYVSPENEHFDSRHNCNAIIESATGRLVIACNGTFIPDGVTSIGAYAFYGCTGLMHVLIPDSVTDIGIGAFKGCSGLVSISVSPGNASYDSRGDCNAIIDSSSGELVAGCKITVIPQGV